MPSLLNLGLIAMADEGHRSTVRRFSSSKLGHLVFLGCGINIRLWRKILFSQKLSGVAYRPGPAQVAETTGSDVSLPDLVASLIDSKLSLKTLMLSPIRI
jgi:hypothetical protein